MCRPWVFFPLRLTLPVVKWTICIFLLLLYYCCILYTVHHIRNPSCIEYQCDRAIIELLRARTARHHELSSVPSARDVYFDICTTAVMIRLTLLPSHDLPTILSLFHPSSTGNPSYRSRQTTARPSPEIQRTEGRHGKLIPDTRTRRGHDVSPGT